MCQAGNIVGIAETAHVHAQRGRRHFQPGRRAAPLAQRHGPVILLVVLAFVVVLFFVSFLFIIVFLLLKDEK